MTDEPSDESHDEDLGPIDCVAVEFPDGRVTRAGFQELVELVDSGVIVVLDLEFIAKQADGRVSTIEIGALDSVEGFDMTVFDGASSGILDQSDLDEIGSVIAPGSVAAVLVYEERSMIPVIKAWKRSGGRVIADCPVAVDDLLAALDATEPA